MDSRAGTLSHKLLYHALLTDALQGLLNVVALTVATASASLPELQALHPWLWECPLSVLAPGCLFGNQWQWSCDAAGCKAASTIHWEMVMLAQAANWSILFCDVVSLWSTSTWSHVLEVLPQCSVNVPLYSAVILVTSQGFFRIEDQLFLKIWPR